MANDEIAKRYASAIYNIAKSSDSINEVREILNVLLQNISDIYFLSNMMEKNLILLMKIRIKKV